VLIGPAPLALSRGWLWAEILRAEICDRLPSYDLESEISGATLSALPPIDGMFRGLHTNDIALFDEASNAPRPRGDSPEAIEMECGRSARC
jgi:hypothetical protein